MNLLQRPFTSISTISILWFFLCLYDIIPRGEASFDVCNHEPIFAKPNNFCNNIGYNIRGGADDVAKEQKEDDDDDESTTGGEKIVKTNKHKRVDSIGSQKVHSVESDSDLDADSEATNNDKNDTTTTSNSSSSSNDSNNDSSSHQNNKKDDDDDDSDNDEMESLPFQDEEIVDDLETIRDKMAQIRAEAKAYHDQGEFDTASEHFQKAANIFVNAYQQENYDEQLIEDYATCRLHQALCQLKNEDYKGCLDSCSSILEDQEGDNQEEQEEENNNNVEQPNQEEEQEVDNDIEESNDNNVSNKSLRLPLPATPAIRARAYHRRAKAKLALDDIDGALMDARSAAFLGDRKAVALYGRLMRSSTGSTSSSPSSSLMSSNDDMFRSMTNGANNPFDMLFPSSGNNNNSNSLMESLLSKSFPSEGSSSSSSPLSPLGGLFGDFPASLLLGNQNTIDNNNKKKKKKNGSDNGGGGGGGIVKNIIQSLSNKLDQEETQKSICKTLNGIRPEQLGQYSQLIGLELNEPQINRLVSICHGITPKTIKKTVRRTKRVVYVVQLIRKCMGIISKYRTLILWLLILLWVQSAMNQPIPIRKK